MDSSWRYLPAEFWRVSPENPYLIQRWNGSAWVKDGHTYSESEAVWWVEQNYREQFGLEGQPR